MGFCITTSFGIDEGGPIVVITTPLVDTGICWPIILALALERLLMTQHTMPMITPRTTTPPIPAPAIGMMSAMPIAGGGGGKL